MYKKLAKQLYWYILGPLAAARNYYRLENKYRAGKNLAEFDIEWSQQKFNRISVINRIIEGMNSPVRYLEIGCAGNECFNSIAALDKTGVDPVAGGTHRQTSDDFFEENDRTFDLVFIDGLHTYEQCRKDAMNALSSLKVGGFVVFHDMLPRNWREEHVPRVQVDWTGDVWRVAVELMQTTGVDLRIFEIDNGVAVAKKISAEVAYFDDFDRLQDASFSDYVKIRKDMPLFNYVDSYDWLAS